MYGTNSTVGRPNIIPTVSNARFRSDFRSAYYSEQTTLCFATSALCATGGLRDIRTTFFAKSSTKTHGSCCNIWDEALDQAAGLAAQGVNPGSAYCRGTTLASLTKRCIQTAIAAIP